MATIKLYLDTEGRRLMVRSPSGLRSITMGETAFISLGQSVKKDEWDKRQCRIKKRRTVTSSTITYEIGMIIIIGF